jgi:hypothetical protein
MGKDGGHWQQFFAIILNIEFIIIHFYIYFCLAIFGQIWANNDRKSKNHLGHWPLSEYSIFGPNRRVQGIDRIKMCEIIPNHSP